MRTTTWSATEKTFLFLNRLMNKQISQAATALAPVGLIFILVGTALVWFRGHGGFFDYGFSWIYTFGAGWLLLCRLFSPLPAGAGRRQRSIHRAESWVAIIFCVAAFFLFYNFPYHLRDWMAFTLAGGLLEILCSWGLPAIAKRFKD